ncbi:MAG TPA: CtsR family transcriptional regulator [Bacillota bacterium]|nr:CtsR family transcriptional regulator [Bacillota bacterium]HPT86597.1 CtsR family transcriptional regulator [Bacillota bacterium]
MGNLADFIEQYLRNILITQRKVELQRRELAKMFRCAPSQINYVLETRFTFEKGYLVESKRGGGGFIRITLVPQDHSLDFFQTIESLIPEKLDAEVVEEVLEKLADRELLDSTDVVLCRELLEKYFSDLHGESAAILRAKLVKAIILVIGFKNRE